MERYTDLKWSTVTDRRGISCSSDEPSTFHVVQSSVLQYALQEDTEPGVTKQRHRRLRDHCMALDALDHYTEKRFSLLVE